jgi:hypothetical protein
MALILAVLRYGRSCRMVHPKTILVPGPPTLHPNKTANQYSLFEVIIALIDFKAFIQLISC